MLKLIYVLLICLSVKGFSTNNQTDDLSPILPPDSLPFKISIVQADFQLPSNMTESTGLQSFIYAVYKGKMLLLAGRTSGLHGFDVGPDNFPPAKQNTTVYVVDPSRKAVFTRSLTDPSSQLSQTQIDTLSVTAPLYYQADKTLYLVGGYGVDTPTGQFNTKSTLTAIDIPGLMNWVESGDPSLSAAQFIRQTSHPLLQVTGGFMTQTNAHQPFLLIFGQNFTGYYSGGTTGEYTQQVRPFRIIDNGTDLYIRPEKQFAPNPNYRRRDIPIIPIIQKKANALVPGVAALSGVFILDVGVWTVPVVIDQDGSSSMADPSNPNTFKQGMNNYECARTGLFSKNTNEMFMLLFGGISYLSVSGGMFVPDPNIPFINSVTTVKIDANGNFQQYLMENQYPVILSEFPPNLDVPLFFGAEARFVPENHLPIFSNGVFSIDELGSSPVLLGYIVGGIQSTVDNTASMADSAASPYIFSVYIQRR